MIVRLATEAMGTRFELVLDGKDEFFLRAVGEEAIQEIQEHHRRLSVFERGSLLSQVNAKAPHRPVPVDDDLFDLLKLCQSLWKETQGAFDPAVGHLMKAWGFRDKPVDTSQRAGWKGGFGSVILDETARTVQYDHPDTALDFGGVAKGWALDQASRLMRESGVERALIHGGTSSAVAIGAPPGFEGWRVEIPSHRTGVAAIHCDLCDQALAVSSPSGRIATVDGESVGHVIDPRQGRPVHGMLVAAVVAGSATAADAWSTARIVLCESDATMPVDIACASIACADEGWMFSPGAEDVFAIRCD